MYMKYETNQISGRKLTYSRYSFPPSFLFSSSFLLPCVETHVRPGENIHNEAEREGMALMGGTKREFKRFRREGKLRAAWSFERRDGNPNGSAWSHEGRLEGEDWKRDNFWLEKKKGRFIFCTASEWKIGGLIYLLLVEILYGKIINWRKAYSIINYKQIQHAEIRISISISRIESEGELIERRGKEKKIKECEFMRVTCLNDDQTTFESRFHQFRVKWEMRTMCWSSCAGGWAEEGG